MISTCSLGSVGFEMAWMCLSESRRVTCGPPSCLLGIVLTLANLVEYRGM